MFPSSSSYLFPARVKCEVLAQHGVLRGLFRGLLEATTVGLRRQGPDLGDLRGAARELHRKFVAHLLFEERALVPILAADELWGPERASELLDEHRRQRAELDTLVEGIEAGWEVQHLALVLRSLTADLLRDMQEEEEGCLRHELLEQPLIDAPRTP
jgi:hypothetical protein